MAPRRKKNSSSDDNNGAGAGNRSNSRSASSLSTKSSSSPGGKKRPREGDSEPSPSPSSPGTAVGMRVSDEDIERQDNEGDENGGGRSPISPKITAKGEADTSATQAAQDAGTSVNGSGTENKKGKRAATDDLFVPLADFDWTGFLSQCQGELREVEGQEAELLAEYRSWEWLHELWSTCRSQSESMRLSREIATIAKWTQLKEAEVEEARVKHTEDMRKISSVLGIAFTFSPPPG